MWYALRAMKTNDLVGALAYNELRERRRLAAATPGDSAFAGVLALLGIVATVVAFAGFLWLALTLSVFF